MAMATLKEAATRQAAQGDDLDFMTILQDSSQKLVSVTPKSKAKAYRLQDQEALKHYQSYTELVNQDFMIQSGANLGLLVNVESNFLLNDVNFVLSRVNSTLRSGSVNPHIFRNTRQEGQNMVLIDSLPAGQYNLILYAHSCLSNTNEASHLSELAIAFDI
jgi:hypothetical protein